MSQGHTVRSPDIRSQGQNVPRNKTPQGQNVPRTKRPKGQNVPTLTTKFLKTHFELKNWAHTYVK